MKKKGYTPVTKVKNPEPSIGRVQIGSYGRHGLTELLLKKLRKKQGSENLM